MKKPKRKSRNVVHPKSAIRKVWRVRILACVIVLSFVLLMLRLCQIQVLEGDKYAQKAKKQHVRKVPLESRRGCIVDRNGSELAIDLPQLYSLGVRPKQVKKKNTLYQELAAFTGRPSSHYSRRMQSPSKFIYLEWRLTSKQADRLSDLNIGGLTLQKASGRFYPYHRATSQILGYTDVDGHGIAGLETFSEETLQGEKGWETHKRDARGVSFWDPLRSYALPRDGGTVRLTIDNVAQNLLHHELLEVQAAYRAEWAGGILINPKTGEILAICSVPDFDPLRPEAGLQSNHKLRPVTDMYEPGSVLKIIGATAALENDIITPEDSIYCENGKYRIGSKILRDAHKYEWLTFEDVMVKSSNIGMAKIAELLGSRELYRYVIRYGFGTPTGIEFPGEAKGMLRPHNKWKPIDLANIAMGQGLSATMLQVALAYAAVANDGILMEPRLILNQTDASGQHISNPPREVRRVMEPRTARTLQKILRKTVEDGTGNNASINGADVAGKTGTAQIPNLEKGGYYHNRYVASFAGFLPADDADRLLVISVVNPQGGHYGAQVAAPVFKRVMQKLRPADAIRKSWKSIPIDIAELYPESESGFLSEAFGWISGGWLSDISHNDSDEVVEDQPIDVVPELKGLSLREAVNLLSKCGIKVEIEGSGWVTHQSLKPGKPIKDNAVCHLKAKP